MIKIRSHYNFDPDENSNECMEHNDQPSLTIQSMTEDADLNVMMKRMHVTGVMPENVPVLGYGDFEEVMDFRSAQHALIEADRSFMMMPAEMRARFANDPQVFLEFCTATSVDGKLTNLEEMQKMGLAIKPIMEKADVGVSKGTGEATGSGGSPKA